MTAPLVWKPLEVGGLRLYRVVVQWQERTVEVVYVLATSPNEAARTVGRARPDTDGHAMLGSEINVLQPAGQVTEDGQ